MIRALISPFVAVILVVGLAQSASARDYTELVNRAAERAAAKVAAGQEKHSNKEAKIYGKAVDKMARLKAKAQARGGAICLPSKCDIDLKNGFSEGDLGIIQGCIAVAGRGFHCSRADANGDSQINQGDLDYCGISANQQPDCYSGAATPVPTATPTATPVDDA